MPSETNMSGGVAAIAAERQRQLDSEGWTSGHDGEHNAGSLPLAAACYAIPAMRRSSERSMGAGVVITIDHKDTLWPWTEAWWKPSPDDRVRELAKAGALIAAEIDRIQRAVAPLAETENQDAE